MRQQTINTFNDGLNYDLNPLVTPNSVLTDCVNGTFITFNGNELSLQNDAGNTVINVKSVDTIPVYTAGTYNFGDKVSITDSTNRIRLYICVLDGTTTSPVDDTIRWREYIVRLTEGFYPLAVKERGGVLYIVSGKNIVRLSSIYDSQTAYSFEQIVQGGLDQDVGIAGMYYKSLEYNNTSPLPQETDAHWQKLGNFTQAQTYNEIEFGSYPSPERFSFEDGAEQSVTINELQLQSYKVLNDVIFQSGEYVTFDSDLDPDFISRTDEIRFYKISLFQQLTSGYKDITDLINAAFEAFTPGIGESKGVHWVFTPDLKFYCPSGYKGKLVARVEIEPMISFTVTIGSLTYDKVADTFDLTLTARVTYADNVYTISATQFIVAANVEGTSVGNISLDASTTVDNGTTITRTQVIHIDEIPGDYAGKTLIFQVIPDFTWDDPSPDNSDLPASYLTAHTYNGSVPLLSDIYNLAWSKDRAKLDIPVMNVCSIQYPGYRIFGALPLVNGAGEYINILLEKTQYMTFAYYKELDYTGLVPGSAFPLASYDIDSQTGKAVLFAWNPLYDDPEFDDNKAILQQLLEDTVVKEIDPTCTTDTLTITITGDANVTTTLTQDGMVFDQQSTKNFSVSVRLNVQVVIHIVPDDDSYEEIWDAVTISQSTTYNYVLIAIIQTAMEGLNRLVLWDNTITVGQPPMDIIYWDTVYLYWAVKQGILYNQSLYGNRAIFSDTGGGFDPVSFAGDVSMYTFGTTGESLPMPYKNVPSGEDYVVAGGVVFRKGGLITFSNELSF